MIETVRVHMAPIEQAQLAQLVHQLQDMLGSERDLTDPALDRLAPNPYPEDVEAAADYRAATLGDLLDRRVADAAAVSAMIADTAAEIGDLSEEEALTERAVDIPARAVDAWLRTFTALRLIIAGRLGVESDEDHDSEDPRFGVYDWLGYRLELLIESAEAQGL